MAVLSLKRLCPYLYFSRYQGPAVDDWIVTVFRPLLDITGIGSVLHKRVFGLAQLCRAAASGWCGQEMRRTEPVLVMRSLAGTNPIALLRASWRFIGQSRGCGRYGASRPSNVSTPST